jgi:ribosomal protein S18 acetylase RimI-like enzyme
MPVPGAAFTAPLVVETLARSHHRPGFSCGCGPLDDYLHRRALQDHQRRAAVCHVLVSPAEPTRVIGYYTLSSYTVSLAGLPAALSGKLPRYPDVPCALLARHAVDTAFRGRRLGEFLLVDAMQRCFTRVASQVAVYALVTHAKNEVAAAFYRRYEFIPLPATPLTLFLPMATVGELFERAATV